MLDQYIMNQLKENDQQLTELRGKLENLQREEESCNSVIQKLLDKEDVGMELFSPRNPNDSTRRKVSDIKKQIATIQLQQAEVGEKINQIQSEGEKYREMLVEVKNRNKEKYQISQLKKDPPILNEKEEFQNILVRVDRCLDLVESDAEQCKKELMNLNYYLKALLSK